MWCLCLAVVLSVLAVEAVHVGDDNGGGAGMQARASLQGHSSSYDDVLDYALKQKPVSQKVFIGPIPNPLAVAQGAAKVAHAAVPLAHEAVPYGNMAVDRLPFPSVVKRANRMVNWHEVIDNVDTAMVTISEGITMLDTKVNTFMQSLPQKIYEGAVSYKKKLVKSAGDCFTWDESKHRAAACWAFAKTVAGIALIVAAVVCMLTPCVVAGVHVLWVVGGAWALIRTSVDTYNGYNPGIADKGWAVFAILAGGAADALTPGLGRAAAKTLHAVGMNPFDLVGRNCEPPFTKQNAIDCLKAQCAAVAKKVGVDLSDANYDPWNIGDQDVMEEFGWDGTDFGLPTNCQELLDDAPVIRTIDEDDDGDS